jgi:hypothetical protein
MAGQWAAQHLLVGDVREELAEIIVTERQSRLGAYRARDVVPQGDGFYSRLSVACQIA